MGDGPADQDPPGRRPRVPAQRVTLQFAGPKLALPGEEPDDQLRLDTSEFVIPVTDGDAPSLELDLEGIDAPAEISVPEAEVTDGWGRMRGGEPSRARSVTPSLRGDDALSLVSERSRPPSTPGIDLGSEMADRYALGDFSGALRVAELLLGKNPNDVRAQKCAESCRERLIQLYSARLASELEGSHGIGARVARVRVPEHEIRWLGLDHRQGFLLSRLDGNVSVEDLVDLSGMTRLEVLRTLVELVEAGAIELA